MTWLLGRAPSLPYVSPLVCVVMSYSLMAIGNILILRGNIEILPPERTNVSYEQLAQLVGEYLLTSCPDVDISAALSTMPMTRSKSGFDQDTVILPKNTYRGNGP